MIVSAVAFVSFIDQHSPSGNIVAQGGAVTNMDINQSANTLLWSLVYGHFDESTGISHISLTGGNVTRQNIFAYGYDSSMVIIAHSSFFNESNISQATPNLIDAYLGVGPTYPESGTNTFSSLFNISIGDQIYELYGAKTISTNGTYITAALLSHGNLAFVSTTENGTAFDGSPTSFQMFLPIKNIENYSFILASNISCPENIFIDSRIDLDNVSILLNWSDSSGVLRNELFFADGHNVSNDLVFNSSINITTNTYVDTTNATTKYYQLRSYLPAYSCDATNTVGMHRIELSPATNLVSFPFEFVNDSILNVSAPIYEYVESINRYNNTDQIYDFVIQFAGSTFKNFDRVLRGEGYWFVVNRTVNFSMVGTVNQELNITLYNRSNLIGFPTVIGNNSLPYLLRSIDGNYSTVNVYNNSQKLYGFYIIFGGSVFSNFDTIHPTLGYWLQANETETLVLP